MITYLEFPQYKINNFQELNKNIKIFTSMSPYTTGTFIPSSKVFYNYLDKKRNKNIVYAQNDDNNRTPTGGISGGNSTLNYQNINVVIGVEDLEYIRENLYSLNIITLKTIKGQYKIKDTLKPIIGETIASNTTSDISTKYFYGFPCYFKVNNQLCSSIGFDNGDFIYYYSRKKYELHKGYYYLDNSKVLNELKTGDTLDFGSGISVPISIYNWITTNTEPVYVNTYTVNSTKGDINYGIIEKAPPMKKANLSTLDNRKTLTLTGENDKDYQIIWSSYTPADKIFLGLSRSPNSSVPLIPVGKEVPVSFNDSTALYEVYGKYKPLSTKFEIHTYKSSAEQNRVDKTNFLTADMIISGVLREASSLIHPSITFTSDIIPTFNYVYIPIFNRYYYVTDITSIKNKLWQMSLTVDVLMTYKEALLACTGYIDRNENEYNGLIPDGMISLQKGEVIETNFVTNELFTETQGTYVLQGLLVTQGDVVTDTHTGSSGDEHSGGGGNFGN